MIGYWGNRVESSKGVCGAGRILEGSEKYAADYIISCPFRFWRCYIGLVNSMFVKEDCVIETFW